MRTFWRYLLYGARMRMKAPNITLIAVITLALGIGANIAIYSAAQGAIAQVKESSETSSQENAPALPALEAGKPVEREIKGGEVHLYKIHLDTT